MQAVVWYFSRYIFCAQLCKYLLGTTKQVYFTAAWYEGLGSLCLRRPLFGSLAACSRGPAHQSSRSSNCATMCHASSCPEPAFAVQKQLMPSWRPKWSGGTWRYQRYSSGITVSQNPHLLQPPSAWLYSQQAACHFLCLIGCPERPDLVIVRFAAFTQLAWDMRFLISRYVYKNFSGGSLQPRCQNARWSALKSVDVQPYSSVCHMPANCLEKLTRLLHQRSERLHFKGSATSS